MKKLLLFIVLIIFSASVFAQEPQDKFKGLYILNITKLIDWPENYKEGDFIITVIGESMVDESFAGQSVINQPISSKKISSLSQLEKSHIVFLSTGESSMLPELKSKLQGQPTIIITDKEGLIEKGASINFTMQGGKLGIEINRTVMEQNGLKVSSALLSLASKVN